MITESFCLSFKKKKSMGFFLAVTQNISEARKKTEYLKDNWDPFNRIPKV